MPPEERATLWVVEAEISPKLERKLRHKKKKRRKKKEVCPERADGERHDVPNGNCFAPKSLSSVPRLPQLPRNKWLVSGPRETRSELLSSGAYPELRPGALPWEDLFSRGPREPTASYRQTSAAHHRISHPFCPDNGLPDEAGPMNRARLFPVPQQQLQRSGFFQQPLATPAPASSFFGNGPYRPQAQGRGLPPIHSRTNLMDAELLDADSDF